MAAFVGSFISFWRPQLVALQDNRPTCPRNTAPDWSVTRGRPGRKLYVQPAIRGARRSSLRPPVCGLGGYKQFHGLNVSWCFFGHFLAFML